MVFGIEKENYEVFLINKFMSIRITLTRTKIGEWISYLPMVGLLALLGAMPFHYGEAQRIAL